jgi:outer membrane protein assembly factor BamB
MTAHRWAEDRLAALERDAAPPPGQLDPPPYVQAFEISMHRGERLFSFLHEPTPAGTQFLRSHFLTYRPPPQGLIVTRDGRTGKGRGIKLPDPLTDATYIQRRGAEHRFVGGMDGHLLVIRNAAMAGVYDVVEQREVARIETDAAPPLLANRRGLSNAFHVGGGVLVEHLLDEEELNHLVRVYDLADGRLLWERRIGSSGFQGVWATDEAVLLAARDGQQLELVDRRTGRPLRRIELAGYLPNHQMEFSPHGLLYRTVTGVAYQPLDASGEPWRLDGGFDETGGDGGFRGRWAPNRFGVLSADRGYIFWNRGNERALSLIDLNRGRELWRQTHEQLGRSVFDAALDPDGRRLAVYGFDRQVQMVLLDARTGELQARADLGRNLEQRVDVRTLARAGPIVPLVQRDPGNRSSFRFRFYRASDGRELEVALPTGEEDGAMQGIEQEPIIRAGTLIVPTERGILGFARDPAAKEEALPLRPEPRPDEARRSSPSAPPVRAEAAAADTGIRLQLRQGRLIIVTPDGQRRDIGPRGRGRLEIRQVDGRVEIRRDGKLVPIDDAPTEPDANPARPADEQAEPTDGR